MNQLISVIITVYNLEEYIAECLESVINQTYKNLEIIIIDDGSTDKSLDICKKYSELDSRIKVYHVTNTGMAAKARNIGLSLANGEYITFVDGDDFIKSDMYENLINACKVYKVDISCCGITRYISNTNKYDIKTTNKISKLSSLEAKKEMLLDGIIGLSVCSKLFSKKIIGNMKFQEKKHNEDFLFVWNSISHTKDIVHIGDAKYYYRIRPQSVTQNSNYDPDIIWVVKNAINMLNESPRELKDYLGLYIAKLDYICLIALQKSKSKKLYKEHYKFYKSVFKKYGYYYLINSSIKNSDKIRAILAYINFYSINLKLIKGGGV